MRGRILAKLLEQKKVLKQICTNYGYDVEVPGGYYTSLIIKGDPNLIPENIVSGTKIFDTYGIYKTDGYSYKIGDRILADNLDVDESDEYGNPTSYRVLL